MQQTQQELETLLDLFEHDGWKLFVEERENLYKSLKENAHHDCNTNNEWQVRRGALLALEGLIAFEGTTKFVYEQGQEETDV